MRIPRIYVACDLATDHTIDLPDSAFQHCCKVLRLKDQHPLILFNGQGGDFEAELVNVEKRKAQVRIGVFRHLENESPLRVTIGQSLSRGERMDYAIQKAVETGVFAIQPLFSERCEVKLSEARLDKRLQHWQQVAISAAEQCGRGIVPQILEPQLLSDWVTKCNQSLKFVMHHHCAVPLQQMQTPTDHTIAALIGPEGGLTENEVEIAKSHGFLPLTLGPRVLRTETAPVVILTAVNLMWGDLQPA